MTDILLKSLAYVLVIILGYVLKRVGLFGPKDYQIISKILFNFTIPAAILSNVGGVTLEASLLLLVAVGLITNVIPLLAGWGITRRRPKEQKALFLLNLPGYNIGAFVLPLAQSFLGAAAMTATCIFDIGNAIMCLGGNFAFAQGVTEKKSRFRLTGLVGQLLHSTPFVTYLVFIPMVLFHIPMPQVFRSLIDVVAPANGFIAMLMLGTTMELKFDRAYLGQAGQVLVVRYLLSLGLALVGYFCTPFPQAARQALVLCLLAPLSAMAPVFTDQAGGDPALAGLINTLSIPTSVGIIVAAMALMGV